MRRPARILAVVILALALAAELPAQEAPTSAVSGEARPRIALVLSGGGARGLAHVGVLRALERMRVPVHVVTGTSMGAIVGALFASGLSPDSLAVVAATADWERLLADTPPRDMLDPRRREEGLRYAVELELGWGTSGPRLPPGLIAGQAIGLYLRSLTLPVAHVEDFDDLPIPFACVATDLTTGEAVVLDHGDLVQAIRASMAIPIVFSPVEIEGRLLVDGGVRNNLPVDLARSMGADFVIAVDASPRLKKDEAIRTVLGVTEQLSTIYTRAGMETQLPLADLVITPELEGYGPFDFAKSDSILARGEASVRALSSELAQWALAPEAFAAWRQSVAPPALPARIDSVGVKAPPGIDPERILGRAGLDAGDPLDPEQLELAAELPFGTGEFQRVEYDLARDGDRNVAVINVTPQPWGRDLLRLGLRLLTDSGGADLRTGLATFQGTVAWVHRAWNARGAESRVEALIGQENALKADWHQPIDYGGRWFVEPSLVASWLRQPLYLEQELSAEYDIRRFQIAVDAGLAPGRSMELRAGLRRGWVETETEGSDIDVLTEADDEVGAASAAFVVDRLDAVAWPHHGVFARAELVSARKGLGSDQAWDRLAVEGEVFRTFGGTTAFLAAGMGSALGTPLPPYEDFRLGGLHSLSGYGLGELRGRYAAAFRAGGFRQIADVPPSFRGVLLGLWLEAGRTWADSEDIELDDLAWAGTIAAGAETVIGSIILAYGRAEDHRSRVVFGLGLPWAPPFRF